MTYLFTNSSRLSISKTISLLFLSLLPYFSLAAENYADQFQAILDAAVKDGHMAVSAQVSWGDNSWSGVSGEASAKSGEPLIADSVFRIASISKLFTATVILQLVDEEVLQLSDFLADLLPESLVLNIPHADAVTIEMLLNHSSGIRSFSDIDEFWDEAYGNEGLDRTWEPTELISYALSDEPYFEPGVSGQKQYSNTNYILLGMIIEEATGESLSMAYRHRIYEPLKLTHTMLEGFDSGLDNVQHSFIRAGIRNRIVAIRWGWSGVGDNGLYDVSGNYQLYNSWAWAAGGIASTSRDLDKFLVAVRDRSLLSESSQSILFGDNSAEGNAGVVFGGSGGWEGITTSAYEINNEIRIILLANTTGLKLDADILRGQLYRALRP